MLRPLLVLVLALACRPDDTEGTSPPDTGTLPDPTAGSAAALTSLDIGVDLEPAFHPDRFTYALPASAVPSTVSVLAETLEPDAQVAIRLETVDGRFLASGDTLEASVGRRIRVDVVSGDGSAARTYAIGIIPDDMPRLWTEGTPSEGWTFLATRSEQVYDRFTMIVDDLGTPAWWRRLHAHDFRVTEDGRLSFYGIIDGGNGPRNLVVSPELDGYDIDLGPGPMPDGWSYVEVDEHEWDVLADGTAHRIILGKVVEDLSPWGGAPNYAVEHQKAQHIDHMGNILFEWSTQGLLPYDQLPPNLYADMTEDDWEPFHINSIAVDPSDGHWVMSLQRVSMVIKVARHGPQEGEVLWKLSGGPGADIEILDDVRPSGWVGFAGQHDVRVTGPDRVSMYDAGLGDSSNVGDPRYVEYQVDVASGTAEKVDEHVWTDWGNGKAGGMAQQLPVGGVLIGFGSLTEGDDGTKVPLATELSPDGEEVWHLYGPDATWSYRAWRQYGDPFDGTWSREP